MPVLLAHWRIPSSGTDRADDAVNTWHFEVTSDPPNPATLVALEAALKNFYAGIKDYIPSAHWDRNNEVKWYNEADPPPRAPIKVTTVDVGLYVGGNALPSENCVTLSYQAARLSGVPQARRRGRIYLPITSYVAAASDGKVSTTVVAAIDAAATALLAASDAAGDWTWVVRSRVTGGTAPVANGWVDNAFDTQRRRGRLPTIRSVFP